MFFGNLGLGQFLGLLGAVSAVSVALYLLDRSRRRLIVSTLRFWCTADQPAAVERRKHIQQPLSLLLQILAMLFLLLAIAQLRLGNAAGRVSDHVLVLETSAWMGARASSPQAASQTASQTLMDLARSRARAYLRALPADDRVMLIRADALATPVTAFETDRVALQRAIDRSEPSATSLNLGQALAAARAAQGQSPLRGEVVFIGAGRIAESEIVPDDFTNLRVLPVEGTTENLGLRKIGLRRSASDPDVWEILIAVRNYGSKQREAVVSAAVSNSPAGAERILLPPDTDREITFTYRTRAAGILHVRLLPRDAFPDDNLAQVEIPSAQQLAVTVYSDQPDALRPILAANRQIAATFWPVSQYKPDNAGLVVIDRFRPAKRPAAPSIWIDPPASDSILPVRMRSGAASLRWLTESPLGAGLRTRDVRLTAATVFETAPGDLKVAETDAGAVVVARPSNPKLVVIGFQPSAIRYELAAPLLFANIFRWLAPETFIEKTITTQPAGTVSARIAPGTDPASIRVLRADGSPVPFTVQGESLHFFSGSPGTIRVLAGERESLFALSLPEVAEGRWTIPRNARTGLPQFGNKAPARDLWQVLAGVGGVLLAFEWLRWGQMARRTSSWAAARLKKVA